MITEMIADYCRRSPRPLTPEQLRVVIEKNHIVVEDGCFIVFAVVFDEIRVLCPYAPKGKTIAPLGRKLEEAARQTGFKRISIITDRPKAFQRLFPDMRPAQVLFEKELNKNE